MIFVYTPVTFYGSAFHPIRLTTGLVTLLLRTLQPPLHRNATGLGCSEFARHYYRNRGFFLFLQVLRWFTSLGSLTPAYVFSRVFLRFAQVGFPIRRSPDITPVCGSPELIAACHVLHRLFLPRHPPCALSSLTIELIPRRKRSCCLLLDIPCIFPPVRLTGYDPRLRTLSKDTQLTSLTHPNLIGIRKLLSLVCNLPNAIRCQITERCGLRQRAP
jgi:hypothetical protein